MVALQLFVAFFFASIGITSQLWIGVAVDNAATLIPVYSR